MRVLHVLHHSAPYLDGYGVRSKYIVDFQRKLGLRPTVLTSAHHEIAIKRDSPAFEAMETIDGVTYYRTPRPGGAIGRVRLKTPLLREQALMAALRATLERTLAKEPVDIIHSHSPILCGRPALAMARRLGVPFVYEIRAFWEDVFLLEPAPLGLSSTLYRFTHTLETNLIRDANAVVAISSHMLNDIAARGVTRSKLHKMPNGVDVQTFVPVARDNVLAQKLGLLSSAVLGFIGTLNQFEGLDCLVRALPAILSRVPQAKLVIVGDGPEQEPIRQQVRQLGVERAVIQVGRVPHDEIQRYYSVMDVLVYPRHRNRVTELVTPLKPLEAMAMGKMVVGSDVGGVAELFDDGKIGVLFKAGDDRDLAERLIPLLENPERRAALAEEGRRYVIRERNWSTLVPRYLPIYEDILGRGARRPA